MDILNSKGMSGVPKINFWEHKRMGTKTKDILPEYSSEEIKISFQDEWLLKIEKKIYLSFDEVFPGTKAALSDLNQDYDLVLVTLRNNIENLSWELSELNLKAYFKSILSGKGPKKNLVANYLVNNKNVDKCLIVGDTEEDIRTGLELNIPTVSVTYGIRSEEFLKKISPDYCISDFRDIINIAKTEFKE